MIRKFKEFGAKILNILEYTYELPTPCYTNPNSICTSGECGDENEETRYVMTQNNKIIESVAANKKDSIFNEIVGYSIIKREFVKALESTSPIGILLVGPPGCGKSEFLKHIRAAYDDKSVFIDG